MSAVSSTAPWLDDLRSAASSAFGSADRPSEEDEVWRYSRIGDVDLERYSPVSEVIAGPDAKVIDGAAATVIIRNGVASIERTDKLGKATVSVITEHVDGQALLNSVRGEAIDAVGHLHDAHLGDVIVIDVPRGVAVEAPIVIDTYSAGEATITCPHTIVRAEAGSQVTVVELSLIHI